MKLCSFPGCEAYCEGQTDYCGSHNAHFRKEKRQAATNALKKPARIQKFSEKKATKILPYAVMRRIYLNSHPRCEVRLTGCKGQSSEIHHINTSDKDFLNTKTWVAICRNCHYRVENKMSAIERRSKGLLI